MNLLKRAAWLLLLSAAAMPGHAAASERPSLVVVIIIDGLPYRELSEEMPVLKRFFQRFEKEGAWFEDARFDHAVTLTAPGHATLLTGAHPKKHGIVANRWVSPKRDKRVYCVEDASARPLKASREPRYGISPHRLLSPTLGDLLKKAHGGSSKVVAVSGKDRSAVLTAGREGTAYFHGAKMGRFVTSTYYLSDYPAWWKRYYREWSRQRRSRTGWSRDRKTLDFALAALDGEGLGARDGAPDLLIVCLSELDTINHHFGPQSERSRRHLRELDGQLDEFLKEVEGRADGGLAVALSADHGFPDLPGSKDGGEGTGRLLSDAMMRDVRAELGMPKSTRGLLMFEAPWFSFNRSKMLAKGLNPRRVESTVRKALEAYPGVDHVLDEKQARSDPSDAGKAVALSWHPKNAGDLYLVPEEGLFFSETDSGCTHGSPYGYDTHVPLMFLGGAFKQGVYGAASAADLAPTLARVAGVTLPDADGKVLEEALAA